MKVYEKVRCEAIQFSGNNQEEVISFIKESLCAKVVFDKQENTIVIRSQIATEHGTIFTSENKINVNDWFVVRVLRDVNKFDIKTDEQFKKQYVIE